MERRRKRLRDADNGRARTSRRCCCVATALAVLEPLALITLSVLAYSDVSVQWLFSDVGQWHAVATLQGRRFNYGDDYWDLAAVSSLCTVALLGMVLRHRCGTRLYGADAAAALAELKAGTRDESSGFEQRFFPPASAPPRRSLKSLRRWTSALSVLLEIYVASKCITRLVAFGAPPPASNRTNATGFADFASAAASTVASGAPPNVWYWAAVLTFAGGRVLQAVGITSLLRAWEKSLPKIRRDAKALAKARAAKSKRAAARSAPGGINSANVNGGGGGGGGGGSALAAPLLNPVANPVAGATSLRVRDEWAAEEGDDTDSEDGLGSSESEAEDDKDKKYLHGLRGVRCAVAIPVPHACGAFMRRSVLQAYV